MAFTGIKIEANGQTLEDGSGWITSDWKDGVAYEPKPKTQYTIGGVPKRSVPNQRLTIETRLILTYDEYEIFKNFFYDGSIDYYTITLGNKPMGRDTNILPMNFDGDIKTEKLMASSLGISFILVEVRHIEL